MTKVVGFDLDDTLVAEALFLKSGVFHSASWITEKYPSIPKERIISCMLSAVMNRQNHYSALECLIEEYGLTNQIDMRSVVAQFRSHLPDPSIYHSAPSTRNILEDLKGNQEVKLVLITDGRSLTQRNKIKAAMLSDYFDEDDIFISEETGADKTHPDTFLRVMEKYAGASEFHYVGDNPSKDFLHPLKLGWHVHQVHPFPLMIHHQGMHK